MHKIGFDRRRESLFPSNGSESRTMLGLKADDKDKELPLAGGELAAGGQTKQTVLIAAQTVCLCPPGANRVGTIWYGGNPLLADGHRFNIFHAMKQRIHNQNNIFSKLAGWRKLDKILPWENWAVFNNPNWTPPPAPKSDQDSESSYAQYSGGPWEPMNLLRALCHPKTPVTDDIISIVRVTWELVAGTHTIQTHYIIWLERCAYHLFFLLSKTKPISSWRNHLLDCHVGFLRLPILAAVKFHKIQ